MAQSSSVPRIRTDLAFFGRVTQVISNTQFVAAGLAGLGDGALVGYAAYVLVKADGTITAPHAEQPAVSAYVTASGTFTHVAYTATLTVGDQLLLLHPNVSSAVTGVATLLTRLSAVRAGYLDELDFDLQGTLVTIAAYIDTEVTEILALVDARVMGRSQVLEASVTAAANAGLTDVATITTQFTGIFKEDPAQQARFMMLAIDRGRS
ncbi:hypothetical protein LCGC14_2571110 [marine sediment metagenome]|uniref:Uncharacterized protein n=1 Tax=marine sediment metagenome TaxID=412755 RepID=A0A0F9CTC6_9ZZZZ